VSQYTAQFDGATTPPLEADNNLLVGTKDGFSFWDTHDDKRYDVKVDKDSLRFSSLACFPKYACAAFSTPRAPLPK